ncbi:hypothetical protein D6D19_06083 [Aureobasidium pullulans]|uniref:Uncharacterized protein n=1 Tax=Aureobasidium pullulans TaxID=5580 RepID=A0A4S8SI74_AURPU|nr:hypothetical protein D6D28_05187 [Aureobasidium pullulans]THW11081.1 hypothetical protein D6D24_07446 [Aureobasidium pullulans]THW31574.1 hypothetical protein D6D22_10078 [Aureobasidium pullulans]THW32760.1 hypothetical protein D6D21_10263 [Aureobasidium pullulans]THW72936.1 hypothetical protein D6D19_06083 [Aureobasidium pullulans]
MDHPPPYRAYSERSNFTSSGSRDQESQRSHSITEYDWTPEALIHDHPREPIVIPQRRPGSQQRGFILAYPPSLQRNGIDQHAFLDFLESCNEAVAGYAALQVLQVAGLAVSMVPDAIAMGVGTGVGVGASALNKHAVRWKSAGTSPQEHHQSNKSLFMPRGLFCMIMTHNPGPQSKHDGSVESAPINHGIANTCNQRDSFGRGHQNRGQLPARIASLSYPYETRPAADDVSQDSGGGMKNTFTRVNAYLDRRAVTQYSSRNSDDVLVTGYAPQKNTYSNRYLDPNHPAVQNGVKGLLSGGTITRDDEARQEKSRQKVHKKEAKARAKYEHKMQSIYEKGASGERSQKKALDCERKYDDKVRKLEESSKSKTESAVQEVLYLTIVNLEEIHS